jgi:gluconolactonase
MNSSDLKPVVGLKGLISENAKLEKLVTNSIWAEGPVWLADRGSLRWSDIPGNQIFEYHLESKISTLYKAEVEFTNGRTLDHDGSVIQCSHGNRRIERDRDGVVEPIVDNWNGKKFNSPNDVIVAKDGGIWFTDPPYGIIFPREGHPGEREYKDHYVFRYDPKTKEVKAVVLDVEEPNGLAFSPDESVIYIADSSALTNDPGKGNNHLRAYDVVGTNCKNGRTFAVMENGVPDGLRVDKDGNVWVATFDGVHVYDPSGEQLGWVPIPEKVSNLCFGGPDGNRIFICASTSIYSIETLTVQAPTR